MAKKNSQPVWIFVFVVVALTIFIVVMGVKQGKWELKLPFDLPNQHPESPLACYDTDGDQKYSKGKTTDVDGKKYWDYCVNTEFVHEYYCLNGMMQQHDIQCSGGEECDDGRCVPLMCTDTDNGVNLYMKGTCADNAGSDVDKCPLGNYENYVTESWCENNKCMGASVVCPVGTYCYDGACVADNTDSDNDGWPDIDEDYYGTNPNDGNDYPEQTDCASICTNLGYYDGYWSGGISCDDFWHYDSASQCCCKGVIPYCEDWCETVGYPRGTSQAEAGTTTLECRDYWAYYCTNYNQGNLVLAYSSTTTPCCCGMCYKDTPDYTGG